MLPPHWRDLAPSAGEALAMAVRDAVLDGTIRVADKLPAERRLASQLGVSRGTVVAAFARLRAEGWLSTRHGSGSTVQIPASLRLRYEPLPASNADGLIDLRRAMPAAPVDAYTAAARRALGRSPRLLLGDGEPGPGLPQLRDQVAARLTGQGLPTGPDQVLITAGARAAMTLLTAYLRPNTAVVESPAFYGILAILRRPGRRIVPVAVTHDGWDAGQLAAAFGRASGGMAVLVPDFHNPTGALMDAPARAHVAALAARAGVTVVVNEVMRDLDLREPPAPLPRIRGAIVVGSLSKTVWAGLRIGWIRAPARLVRELLLHPFCQVCTPPPIEQLTACELLPGLDGLLRQRLRDLRSQRDHLAAALGHDRAWTFALPPGGLWLWLRLASMSGDALAARAAAAGLAVLPGSRFSADGTLASYLRVPFTAPPATLDRAATLLRAALGNRAPAVTCER
jgi:DNA-binding transcriptional MocR family regulator